MFMLVVTKIEGKEKTTKTIGTFEDVTECIRRMINLAEINMLENMHGIKYWIYVIEPVTETVIRKMYIE